MKNRKFLSLQAILCIFSLFNIEAKNVVTVNWNDLPYHTTQLAIQRNLPLSVCPPDSIEIKMHGCDSVPIGGSREYEQDFAIRVYKQSIDEIVPVEPKRHIRVSIRKITAVKPEPMLCVILLSERRRVMLNNPPVYSPWHSPGGISMLTSFIRKDGHDVRQRWGHIIGLEYILLAQNKTDVCRALAIIRSQGSNVQQFAESRQILERTSESITTKDKFRFERNNVVYQSQYQDGTIRGALNAIENRENNLWYPYFSEVEMPVAREFNPHVYGISIGDERQLFPGLVLASMVKTELPDCVVIVGGNFFGRMPDPKDYPDFALLFDHLDGVVYAEGFEPLKEIARTLDVSTTSGMIWRSTDGVVKNPRTTSPTDFNSLQAPALDGSATQWAPETEPTLYTSSHCPLACDFCDISAVSDTFSSGRLNDAQKIKPRTTTPRQIAERMRSTGAHKFDITDELFPVQQQLELGRELRSIGYYAEWQSYLTVTDNLLNPQVAKSLYDAGCRAVQFGLETLSKETLFKLHKQWNTPSSYDRILQNFRDAGIHTHVFLMVGLPSEPLSEGLKWVGFLEKYGHNILTIKSGRWRPARKAPEVEKNLISETVELGKDDKPFHANRSFKYRSVMHSSTKVDAMRDIVEQACRRHWAYNITSTIPWWINRSRYTWDELEEMAKQLPIESDIPHLDDRIAQMRFLVRNEMGREADFRTWDELVAFSKTLL